MDSIDFETFLNIIYEIPSCIFFKDTELRYVFCTKHWEQQNTDNIIGKTDIEIRKDKENAIKAMEAGRAILETGKGCSYVIKSDIEGGSLSYLELIKEPIRNKVGKIIGIVGLINDVTEKVLFAEKLKELSSFDSLTHLYNRSTGVEIIEKNLKNVSKPCSFLMMDLNSFKEINDTYGHQMGDVVLKEFSNAIRQCLSEEDVAMRLGGDEFIVFLSDTKEEPDVIVFINKLTEKMNAIKIEGFDRKLTASIGVTVVREPATFDELYNITDKAMYRSKDEMAAYTLSKSSDVD